MAFDTDADHAQTALNIIEEALELCGVLEDGESASTNQQTSGLRTLNNLIKLWGADTQIYAQEEYQLDLSASTSSYPLGSGNTTYVPLKVINATLINTSTNVEIPLSPLTQEEWYSLTDKTTEGQPTQYYFKRNPVGVDSDFYVWPTPSDTTYDIKLWLQYPLRDVDLVSQDVYFTQEWFLPLSFKMAALLSHKYGLPRLERQEFDVLAESMKLDAESFDVDGSVYLQPARNNG